MEAKVILATLLLVLLTWLLYKLAEWAGATQMSIMNWIGLVLAVLLGVYLFVALLFPEKFE